MLVAYIVVLIRHGHTIIKRVRIKDWKVGIESDLVQKSVGGLKKTATNIRVL